MININNNIKTAYFSSTKQIDRIILDSTPYYITNVEYSDNCYDEGNVFGTAEARQLEFEIENSINLEGKEYEYQTGIEVNGSFEWISLGNFITYDVEEDDTKGITKVYSMDYMIKSNVIYNHIDISSGITIKNFLVNALNQCGLVLGNQDFVNSNFVINSDQFEDNALIRQIIIAVAQISGTFAKIRSDNKLYFINPNKELYGDLASENSVLISTEDNNLILLEKRVSIDSNDDSVNLSLRDYEDTTLKRNTHEINTLVLGMSNIEGENVTVYDAQMVADDGENKIVINDNPFAYTQELRTQLINPIFNSIKGFSYTAYELEYQGLPFLECGDSVRIETRSGIIIDSYVFRYSFKSPNGLESTLQAPSLTDAEVKYENVENLDTRLKRTEIVVDKQAQTITAISSEVSEQEDKISQLIIDVDSIRTLVENTIDLTKTVEDTDTLTLDNCMSGYLYELHIYGNNSVFGYLYPRNDIFPNNELFPYGDSLINVWTDNICDTSNWVSGLLDSNGAVQENSLNITSGYISIQELQAYLSLEDSDYAISKLCAYDVSKANLSGITQVIVKQNYEIECTFPSGTKFVRFSVKKKDNINIALNELSKIKPMLVYGSSKIDYCGYNNAVLSLGVDRQLNSLIVDDETIYDEFILSDNRAKVIRRLGVINGQLYVLPEEVTEDLGDLIIPLAEGINYFNILNYNANCKATFVTINDYTKTFATTVEVSSAITQLAESITIEVNKKVGQQEFTSAIQLLADQISAKVSSDDIIAELNLAIEDGQGVINIIGNLIKIATDYFKVNLDGTMEATGGKIANFTINNNALESQNCGMSSNQYIAFWTKVGNVDTFQVTWNGDISCATILVDGNPLIKTIARKSRSKNYLCR